MQLSAFLEGIGFFLILWALAFFLDFPSNYFHVSPHPFWIAVILISCQYGTAEGLFTAVLASVLYLHGPFPQKMVSQESFDYFFLLSKMPILWISSAVILGELRLKHIRECNRYKEEANLAAIRENKIAESYNALKAIKEQLEYRVASEQDTCLLAIGAFKKMEAKGREQMLKGIMELVKVLVAPEKFSLYLVKSGNLQLQAAEGWDASDTFQQTISADSPLFDEVIRKGKAVSIYSSPQVFENQGLFAVPVMASEKKEILGMIKIEQIPFLRLRTSTEETLREIGEWVGAIVGKKQ